MTHVVTYYPAGEPWWSWLVIAGVWLFGLVALIGAYVVGVPANGRHHRARR